MRHSASHLSGRHTAPAVQSATDCMSLGLKFHDNGDPICRARVLADGWRAEAETSTRKVVVKKVGTKKRVTKKAPVKKAAVPKTAAARKTAVSRKKAAPAKKAVATKKAASKKQRVRKGV